MRVVVWGCGAHGQAIVRQLVERVVDIVGVIDRRPERVGRDVSEIAGIGQKLGIAIDSPDRAVALLRETSPDACIVCTRTTLSDVHDQLATTARSGVDCITLSEEAFFPWNSAPELAAELDRVAKAHACTITGGGANDTFLGWIPLTAAAFVHRIDHLSVTIQYDVDGNRRLMDAHGVGLDRQAFARAFDSNDGSFYSRPCAEWLCSALGWRIQAVQQSYLPVLSSAPVRTKGIGGDIPPGDPIGMDDCARVETADGRALEYHCVGKVYTDTDEDRVEYSFQGSPDTTLILERPDHLESTCASLINRLPQLIQAPAGYITTDRFPAPRYADFESR